jgi:hypothetical protein
MTPNDRLVSIPYPVFLIAAADEGPALITEIEGKDWFPLYGTQELAELYIEQIGGSYVPSPVDEEGLIAALRAEPGVAGFVFNSVVRATYLQFIAREDFLGEQH